MSSNSGTILNRSNDHSPFMNAIKSRNSKSLPELYSSEINTEKMAQSKVEVESSSAPGLGGRTLRIALPRYGILNRLYVHTRFGGAVYTVSSTTNGVTTVPFLGAFFAKEYRIMYNGSILAKMNPHTLVSEMWKHSSQREKLKLKELLGGYNCPAAVGTNITHNGVGADVYGRFAAAGALGGIQDFYLPLDMWFSSIHSPNRGLDLSVLANECVLEIDTETESNLFIKHGTVGTMPTLLNCSAVCYLTELDMDTEKQFRSLQYSMGSPLTQLAYDTSHIIVSGNTAHTAGTDTVIDVKLNQFSSQVFKLVVYATMTDNFATNRHRLQPIVLNEIQIKATGSNIYNADNLNRKEDILEAYQNGGDMYSASVGDYGFEDIACNPQGFYEISFKHPQDFSKVSASGSCAFGQLSTPSLRVVVGGDVAFGAQSNNIASSSSHPVDLHVIAYSTTLISYNTNSSGSTNIRQIMN